MDTRVRSFPLVLPVLAALLLSSAQGCTDGPAGFEHYEVRFLDTLYAHAPEHRVVVVLEQLPDGPLDRYADVTYDHVASNRAGDSVELVLEVEGVAFSPDPFAYAEMLRFSDSLFVWYADEPRPPSYAAGKGAGSAGAETMPPEAYLKVRHVTIHTPIGVEVAFSNRFVR